MRRLLIISPYFPPSNAADMHRVRMSLPYFKEYGWEATVVAVAPQYSEQSKDDLLEKSLPIDVPVHYVKAFDKKITAKLGLGSIAIRSLYYYYKKVNELLSRENFDLIYFSTTQFPVCVLGAVWKKKFAVPYVIDFQDPWFSTYYDDKPKSERPRKHWFSHRLNKYIEPIAVKNADGLISVSAKYIADLKARYPEVINIPTATVIFGASEIDRQIAFENQHRFPQLFDKRFRNLVYVGRGGHDMHKAINLVFEAVKQLFVTYPYYAKILKLHFIGTSYAPKGAGTLTIAPLAKQYGLSETVVEITDRVGYYEALAALDNADALFVPGSDDPAYVASKLLPFLFARKPLLAIFNSNSPAIELLTKFRIKDTYMFDKDKNIEENVKNFLVSMIENANTVPDYPEDVTEAYSAKALTKKQTILFDQVINHKANATS
ncbi:glycosyltransferase [Mucilaginibacter achroorhodeus]|nr:glycosyltransferase [Mucilaginibacter achroorhodeus]